MHATKHVVRNSRAFVNAGRIMPSVSFGKTPEMKVFQQQLRKMNMMSHQSNGMFVQMPTRQFSSYPDHLTLEMPALSPTMEKGNLGSWNKKVGDTIAPGDVLCSIETDKATIDYEMQDEGYIAKLLYPEGAKDIPLGSAMAIVVDNEEDIPKFADYTVADGGAATPAPAKAAEAPEPTPAPAAPVAAPQPAAAAPAAPARSGDRVFASPLAQNFANA